MRQVSPCAASNIANALCAGLYLTLFSVTGCSACTTRYYCYSEDIYGERPFAGGSATSVYRVNQDGQLLSYGARIMVDTGSLRRQPNQQLLLPLPSAAYPLSQAQLRFEKRPGRYIGAFVLKLSLARGGRVTVRTLVPSSLLDRVSEGKLVRPRSTVGKYPDTFCTSTDPTNSTITIAVARFLERGEVAPFDPDPAPPDDTFGCPL
jgi:hypothetical protein